MEEIRWVGPEFERHNKGPLWDTVVVIIAALLIVIALLWQRNFLFAVFIGIAAAAMIFWGRKEPPLVEFVVDGEGLAIGARALYRYGELSGFAVSPYPVATGDFAEIVFHRKEALRGHLKIFIPVADVDRVREALAEFLPELEYEESFADHLSRIIKF